MIPNIIALFKDLPPLQRFAYLFLLLSAVLMPQSWHLALYSLVLVLAVMIASACVSRRIFNRSLDRLHIVSMILMVLLAGTYALSLLQSENLPLGKAEVEHKILFVVFAAICLLFDFSFLNKKHLLGILQFMTAALLVRLFVRVGISVHHYFVLHTPLSQLTGVFFDPIHHSYQSMYILLAISYLFTILLRLSQSAGRIVLVLFAMLSQVAYLLAIQSRAGILSFLVLALFGLAYITFVKRRYLLGIISLSALILGAVLVIVVLPDSQKRFTTTFKSVVAQNYDDERYGITKGSLQVVKDNMPWGVGAGDRITALRAEYKRIGANKPYEHKYNPHNQFIDTLMTTGILGFALLLAMFVLPTISALHRRDYLYLAFLFIVVSSALFESIFERQMGIMFFGYFFCLMAFQSRKTPPR